ncbi:MAG: hypothetical protein K2O60_06625 [Ruminococcus sp.]|nr:hypothetical protein [Ruminococcus sp.]
MKHDREDIPTPGEMASTLFTLTKSQKLQVEAIFDLVAALLINVNMAAQTEDKHNLINRKEN